ncbi:hypothetical protein DITRI_Ditri15bG0105300 [Diplodiscus trichospermus]
MEDNRNTSGDNGMNYSELKLKKLAKRVNPKDALILNVKGLQAGKSLVKGSFLQSIFGIGNKIPRHVVLDEKYLRRCLELIHINAAKATQCNFSVNLSSVKMGILSDGVNSAKIRDEDTCDLGRFVFDCPLAVGTGGVVIGPAEQWVVGSISGSRSMSNILKSPLLQEFGALDIDPSLNDVKGSISYDFMSSPAGFINYFSPKVGSETPISDTREFGTRSVHKRLVSASSTNSTCSESDQSLSSTSTTISRGMIQCTWKGGIPYFVFSLDEQREVYIANLSKEGSARSRGLDYMYLFHSSKGNHKEHRIRDNESHLVGKMKVSTSFSVCSQDSKILETEFVLFSGTETFSQELQTSSHNHRKNKGPPKKVRDVFKSSHSSKQKMISRFRRSSSIIEDSSWDPCQDKVNCSNGLDRTNLLEEQLPPNFELAAIVVRDHFTEYPQPEVGGWGLKFLRKAGVKQTIDTLEAPVPCSCNTSDCLTSMDILVPAGIHGGPRTSNGGPSSLIERWRSGGHCDCGGWDLGCPLTVLKARSSKEGSLPPTDMSEACKLFDFFIQGSKHGSPTLRIANIHDGLYFIHFQSTLSALQSFSMAVAYIHTQSPTLRPKNVQQLRTLR